MVTLTRTIEMEELNLEMSNDELVELISLQDMRMYFSFDKDDDLIIVTYAECCSGEPLMEKKVDSIIQQIIDDDIHTEDQRAARDAELEQIKSKLILAINKINDVVHGK